MKIYPFLLVILVLIVGSMVAACSPDAQIPETESGSDILPPVAVVNARQALADHLGVGVESVAIQDFERAEWSDSCLGLGGPAESCLAVITPGWRVNLLVDDQDAYEVRTDELGDVIRINQ
jgi:hypothetical protein